MRVCVVLGRSEGLGMDADLVRSGRCLDVQAQIWLDGSCAVEN